MKPIRHKKTIHVTRDESTGTDRVLGCTQEDHNLTDQKSIDSVTLQRTVFLDCGCNAEPAGKCYECGAISCQGHHGICQKCQKPICMEHSVFVESSGTEPKRLCRRCADKTSRQLTRRKIGRFCLSLFFETRNNND